MKLKPIELAPPLEDFHFDRWKFDQKQTFTLRWDEIRPSIRLAHHLNDTLNFGPRIIFDTMLLYVIGGGTEWRLDDRKIEVGPGDLILTPPFEPHSSSTGEDRRCEHIAIHFDWNPSFAEVACDELGRSAYKVVLPEGLRLPPLQKAKPGDGLPRAFEKIVELRDSGDSASGLQADAILFEVLANLLRQANRGTEQSERNHAFADRARVDAAIARMKTGLHAPLDIPALAKAAGLSPSRFSHLFREVSGVPPMGYLMNLRIERARQLLGNCRLSIKEIAANCGFDDPYHFSKLFSKLNGISPSQFRESFFARLQLSES